VDFDKHQIFLRSKSLVTNSVCKHNQMITKLNPIKSTVFE